MWPGRITLKEQREQAIIDFDRARERTMNRAVRLLVAKSRSIAELRGRLLEKSWTNEEIVDCVIEKLKEYKYLDDQQYARGLAVSKLKQKPQGKRKLKQILSQKKIDKETVDEAIMKAYERLPEDKLIIDAIKKRRRLKGRPETREDIKKFLDYLLRRGFTYDLIREKMPIITGHDERDIQD